MDTLNLPAISPRLKKDQGKIWIFDTIRKKHVILTPEEWVRQHFIQYLINTMNYPRALFRVEKGLTYNTLQKRSDIVIYSRLGEPWMLVECKSSSIKLTQKAFNQVALYNMTVGAKYLSVTNGMVYYCWCAVEHSDKTKLLNQFPALP